jgi:hypothetical protein
MTRLGMCRVSYGCKQRNRGTWLTRVGAGLWLFAEKVTHDTSDVRQL